MMFYRTILYTVLFFLTACTSASEKKTSNSGSVPLQESDKKIPDTALRTEPAIQKDSIKYQFVIEGNYLQAQKDVDCKMDLKIYRHKGQFRYQLKTNTNQFKGDVVIAPNEQQDGYYITLKDIEWSEYEGAIPETTQVQNPENIIVPQEVQGMLYANEITIQNTGNAMNYYVKFEDCDLKYIRLVKIKE